MKGMSTQTNFTLNHLIDHGYITDAVAQTYRIRRLAARIYDLEQGRQVLINRQNRRDELGQKYTYYFLSETERYLQRLARTQAQSVESLAA